MNLSGTGSSAAGLPLDILAGLTLIAVAPFIVVMMTSFVRIIVVLSLVRSAIGAQSLPPNIVLTGLALVLTMVVMSPTITSISSTALTPYGDGKISQTLMLQRATVPLRGFMERQTRKKDLEFFARVAHEKPDTPAEALPLTVVIPAFVVGELRAGFTIGFSLYLPFIAIDLAVATILMGLGMMMLSPNIVSLPCKLFLFVMIDGWSLVAGGITQTFR